MTKYMVTFEAVPVFFRNIGHGGKEILFSPPPSKIGLIVVVGARIECDMYRGYIAAVVCTQGVCVYTVEYSFWLDWAHHKKVAFAATDRRAKRKVKYIRSPKMRRRRRRSKPIASWERVDWGGRVFCFVCGERKHKERRNQFKSCLGRRNWLMLPLLLLVMMSVVGVVWQHHSQSVSQISTLPFQEEGNPLLRNSISAGGGDCMRVGWRPDRGLFWPSYILFHTHIVYIQQPKSVWFKGKCKRCVYRLQLLAWFSVSHFFDDTSEGWILILS